MIKMCLASCSQFNEDLLINSSNPMEIINYTYESSPIQFEFWSFYIASYQVTSYPWIEQEPDRGQKKTQLLFVIKNLDDNQVLSFIYLNLLTNTQVIHSLYFDGNMNDLLFNPSDYEGVWILNVITINDLMIQYETKDNQIQNQNQFQFIFKNKINNIQLVVGGSGIINNKYQLGIFRGRLSKLFIHNDLRDSYLIYLNRIKELRIKEFELTIELIPNLVNFDGKQQQKIEFQQFGKTFSIYGWVKYFTQDVFQLKKYLLVRLTIFNNYKDEIDVGDEILKITVDLDPSDQARCGYDLISHHYWMPYPQLINENAQNDRISLRGNLEYFQILSNWHFISFQHGIEENGSKSKFKLTHIDNNNLITNTYYLGNNQFSNLFINKKYYAIFGGDYTVDEKMKGQIASFYFKSNFKEDLNFNYICHYSCKTCFGPLFSNCLTCKENDERVMLDLHQCVCQIDYFERDQKCQSQQEIFPTLIFNEVQIYNQNIQCLFGYFYLPVNQQCIRCPQWNSYNLLCADCLLNPNAWYIRPICTIDFITQQLNKEEDAYSKQMRSPLHYDLYYIDQNYNLILLEGVSDYCDIKQINSQICYQLNIQHLQTDTFVNCKENRYYANQSCILLDNACVKLNQSEIKCIQCLTGYYISDQGTACLLCPESCPYCQNQNNCKSCQPNYGLSNGKCIPCGDFCKICQQSQQSEIMQCLSCIDNQLYYLSLNGQDCKVNQIENCVYAFESSQSDLTVNSLDYSFIPYYQATITKCAKCKEGYYFHEVELTCKEYYPDLCQTPLLQITENNGQEFVCLFGDYNPDFLIYSFTNECPRIKQRCIYCVIEQLTFHLEYNYYVPKKVYYTCLVCENGYYAEKKTGDCLLCPSDLHCIACYQENKFTKDNWKIEIRAFYKASIDQIYVDHKFTEYGLSQNDSDYEIICTKCQYGYELHKDRCINICPEWCLECVIENYTNICVKCPLGFKGRNRSLVDNQCISCPKNCKLCQKRDDKLILSINPLFNNQELSYFSYYCIVGFDNTIFDEELGLYVDCEDGSCFKQIIINLNLFCNNTEYQQQIGKLQNEEQIQKFKLENILSEELFSSQSFSQFETQEFYQMANEKQIKQILIKIVSLQQQSCNVINKLQISQQFSSNIFSAIDVELEIQGNGITTFQFQYLFSFVNFKKVRIEGISIEIEKLQYSSSNLLKFTSIFEQTVELININYDQDQDYDQATFYTIIENAKNVLIQNFFVKNYKKQFHIEALLKIEQTQSEQTIKISNCIITSSSFLDLHLLWFNIKENDQVEIEDLNIETTIFNQSLIYQLNGKLLMNKISIQECQIYSQNGLFQIDSLKYFELISLDFIFNQIYSGKFYILIQILR
ncbi:unnamed protein product [Paramecium pentaurelia]|uniref:Uncharacterized protein n=1 Tax=Paramecium pentaurelia TaxID=43138 RepID=A0A8S1W8M2_9CILI|nr:unnamed protein product [Paramecium pentaurelia]